MNATSQIGSTKFGTEAAFNGVKVFSATMVGDRERLGDKITGWLQGHPSVEIREAIVTQSSDEAFHCIAITLFFWDHSAA